MQYSIELYEKITNDWQKTYTIWYEYITELKEYRLTYERYTEHVLQFSPELKNQIIQYYTKTKWLIFCLESSQRRKEELVKVYQNTIKNVKQNHDDINEDLAKEKASHLMKDEDMEFNKLNQNIESNIAKLSEFKDKARLIIEQLKKEI